MDWTATLTTPDSGLKNISQNEEDPRALAMSYVMYKIGKKLLIFNF